MDIPLIEQVKIQAQVLVPLVKALQAELGEERANVIVRKALGDLYRKYGEKWWRAHGARNLEEKVASAFEMFAAGDALEYKVVKKTEDRCTGTRVPADMQRGCGFFPCRRFWCQRAAHRDANHHARRRSL